MNRNVTFAIFTGEQSERKRYFAKLYIHPCFTSCRSYFQSNDKYTCEYYTQAYQRIRNSTFHNRRTTFRIKGGLGPDNLEKKGLIWLMI